MFHNNKFHKNTILKYFTPYPIYIYTPRRVIFVSTPSRRHWTKNSSRWPRNRNLPTISACRIYRTDGRWGPFSADPNPRCAPCPRTGISSSSFFGYETASASYEFGTPLEPPAYASRVFFYACICRISSSPCHVCAAFSCTCTPSSAASCSCGTRPTDSPLARRSLDTLCPRSSVKCNGRHSSSRCRTPPPVSKLFASVSIREWVLRGMLLRVLNIYYGYWFRKLKGWERGRHLCVNFIIVENLLFGVFLSKFDNL